MVNKSDLLGRFYDAVAARQPRTATTYMPALRRFFAWLGDQEPSRDLAQEWIDELVMEGRLKNNTIATYANALRRLWRWQGQPLSLDTPALDFGNVKSHPVEDIQRMLELADPLEKVIVGLTFDTACRPGEILALTVADVDWEQRTITVIRKGGRSEEVPILTDKAFDLLRDWNDRRGGDHAQLFLPYCSGNTDKAKADWIRLRLERLAHRAGIKDFTPHHLRHSRATNLLDQGVPLESVSEIMGHTNLNVTAKVYTKQDPAKRRESLGDKKEW
ncbi:MAG: site-specific integrase [Anaerolineales bacterium]|nr:site-specific integrase [Anaerolineales bacterium]